MRTSFLPFLAMAGTAMAASTPDVPPPSQATASSAAADAAPAAANRSRLPGYAAELGDQPRISGPAGWTAVPRRQALAALAVATPRTRQRARWSYAKSLIGARQGAEALGVLDVMLQDEPDLALVPSFQLARGAVLAQLRRPAEALAALAQEGLDVNSEACLWRIVALVDFGAPEAAIDQGGCAGAALTARSAAARMPFIAAYSDAALRAGRPAAARRWIGLAPARDPAAGLWRGRILLALGRGGEAQEWLERAAREGSVEQRNDARLSLLEAAVARRRIPPPEALRRLEQLRYVWRGDRIEERALRLSYRLYRDAGDSRGALAAGAALVRHFDLAAELPALMSDIQADLGALLAPASSMPIDQAAGIYWDYRDLAPVGGAGDRLVEHLADRLQHEGLYARAAELLGHRLRVRTADVTQGPLSVRVAMLHILAARPDRALAAIRDTDRTIFPREMQWDRSRIQAVALHQLGRGQEALAVLQDVPASAGLRSELLWKQRDWNGLVAVSGPALPRSAPLNAVNQAVVLRYAIALGMLGREQELALLRVRYAAGFADQPTAGVFDVLTREVGSIDAQTLTEAMAAIPAVSPAGEIADLLDLVPPRPAGA